MNKPKIYKSFEDWQESEKKYIYNSKREEWTTSNVDRIVWNACQASMQAQLDEKNREITRITKNYAYCSALLKNLVDRSLLSNEAMEAVNNFIKQSEGL